MLTFLLIWILIKVPNLNNINEKDEAHRIWNAFQSCEDSALNFKFPNIENWKCALLKLFEM